MLNTRPHRGTVVTKDLKTVIVLKTKGGEGPEGKTAVVAEPEAE